MKYPGLSREMIRQVAAESRKRGFGTNGLKIVMVYDPDADESWYDWYQAETFWSDSDLFRFEVYGWTSEEELEFQVTYFYKFWAKENLDK